MSGSKRFVKSGEKVLDFVNSRPARSLKTPKRTKENPNGTKRAKTD